MKCRYALAAASMLLVVLTLQVNEVSALPTRPGAETVRAPELGPYQPGEQITVFSAYAALIRTYGIPLCLETWHPKGLKEPLPKFELPIPRNASLGHTLDTLVEETESEYEWRRISDVLCIVQEPPPGVANNFDARISLSLQSASPWEAFKALTKAINANRKGGRETCLFPPGVATWKRPPKALLEGGSISLSLSDVPAREAACAIVAAAPVEMSFQYVHKRSELGRDAIRLDFWKNGERWLGESRLTQDENEFWIKEIKESYKP